MPNTLKKNIRTYLDRTGQSIAGFERAAGLKTNVLRNILNGFSLKPTEKTLSAIAGKMKCSVPSLLGKEEEPFAAIQENSLAIEDPDLCVEVFQAILQTAKAHDRKLTVHKACLMLDEVYAYTMQKKLPAVDEEFITWFVLKSTPAPSPE